eukprot:m.36957 g.36957  ORF g.36957 m.36957 type:complete len:288 (-) comp6709_c4_seq1:2294-3157(-)
MEKKKRSSGEDFRYKLLSGATTGAITTICLQPLDVVKTQLQLATVTTAQRPQGGGFSNIASILRNVYSTQGVRGFWMGLSPSMIRTVPGIALYLSSVESVRSKWNISAQKADVANITIGALCRTGVSIALLPFTVVKTRVESARFGYTGVGHALSTMYKHEGFKSLFRGGSMTLLRDVPFSGMYLFWAGVFKEKLEAKDGSTKSFIAGILAGSVASILTQPFDVTKTMIQATTNQSITTASAMSIMLKTPSLIMSGIWPRLLRRSVVASLNWTLFEKLQVWMASQKD